MTWDDDAHARRDDPDTSHDAAHELSDRAELMIRCLLHAYSQYGDLTSEEAAEACAYTADDGPWKRVSDLKVLGYIEPTGVRRTSKHSGRGREVLAITPLGKEVVSGTRPMGTVAAIESHAVTNERRLAKLKEMVDKAEALGRDSLPLSLLKQIMRGR